MEWHEIGSTVINEFRYSLDYEDYLFEEQNKEVKEMKTAMFTGHRQISNPAIALLKQVIAIAVNEYKIEKFISGMALGTDLAAAEILNAKGLNWTAAIPYAGQGVYWKWTQENQERYADILKGASEKIVLSPKYHDGCMQVRNQWMVNNSDVCIAVYDGRLTGGTAGTVKMARDAFGERSYRNLPIIQINPKTMKISRIEPVFQASLF